MAKRCPERGGQPVIYIDCAECENRNECMRKSREEYEKIHQIHIEKPE